MNSIRAFLAIDIDPKIKEEIFEFIKQMFLHNIGIKWVKPDNLHLTLAFLGETPMDKISPLCDIMKKISNRHKAFTIKLSGFGCFPNLKSPRVIWIGVQKSRPLFNLKKDIDAELDNLGLTYDKKTFSPHLTIGRVKTPVALKPAIFEVPDFSASFSASEIHLVKSDLFKDGPVYTDVFTCSLKN
jgi:2'-5' RNA ligase